MTTRPTRARREPDRAPARSRRDPELDIWELAKEQGVSPVPDVSVLFGDFWPEDEGPDDFIEAMKRWDKEGE